MQKRFPGLIVAIFVAVCLPRTATATCSVFGDSIGLGLGHALNGLCQTTAEIGILSTVVASRVQPGSTWTVVSLGSNDFPTGLSPAMRAISETRVRKALDDVAAKIGRGLILIVPANDARPIVGEWASRHGIETVGFEPGTDGVHPRKSGYDGMARKVGSIVSAH